MAPLLALVGKALGSILRGPGSTESSGRNRSSFDSDSGLEGSLRVAGVSATGASLVPEPSSLQRSNSQKGRLENLVTAAAQGADPFAQRSAGRAIATASSSGSDRASVKAGRNSSTGGALTSSISATAIAAAASATAAAGQGMCSDTSGPGNSSPLAASHFFRASRASLSDTTASVAGEALRQASVTTCKHFTRENYNNYVKWVRATRGARLAGKMRSRESAYRNPHPTLLLRCEHWLEVTDEQHRYGSNLRLYFDFWVAEMEAAELTPPQSPALMSPSPSCGHLVALAQQQHLQQQQQQIASAIADAAAATAAAERTSPNPNLLRSHHGSESRHPHHSSSLQREGAFQGGGLGSQQVLLTGPPHQQQQQQLQQQVNGVAVLESQQQQQQFVVIAAPLAVRAASADQCQSLEPSTGPGPSRFSNDANATPRLSGALEWRRSYEQHKQATTEEGQEQQQQQQQEQQQEHPGPNGRAQQLSNCRRKHNHYHCHPQHDAGALAPEKNGTPGTVGKVGERDPGADGAGGVVLEDGRGSAPSSKSSHTTWDDISQLETPQEAREGQQHASQVYAHLYPHLQVHHYLHHLHHNHRNHHRNHHNHNQQHHCRSHHDLEELYEREGSVHHGIDDGGVDSLPASLTATRSHDGDEDDMRGGGGGGRVELLFPPGEAADASAPSGAAPLRCVAGSCDPPPTLLQRRQQLQQQRRRSCGEANAGPAPSPVQPRTASGVISLIMPAASAMPAMAVHPQPQLSCPVASSPRRSVLCSPSRRFVLAAMIDMSSPTAENDDRQQEQQRSAPDDDCQQQQQQDQQLSGQVEVRCAGGEQAAQEGLFSQQFVQQQQQDGPDGIGAAPPATPQHHHHNHQHHQWRQPPQQQQQLTFPQPGRAAPTPSQTPATPALTSCNVGGRSTGGGAPGSCTAQRVSKLLSNRASVGSGTSFFRWLDNGPGLDVDLARMGVSRAKLDAERVKYLTPDELLEYELDVDMETGLLRYKRSGKLLHTGPDGRGSLDEHRRPPTPPPPAVPLSLLGEGAAAWWRGSGSTIAVTEPQSLPSQLLFSEASAAAAAPVVTAGSVMPPLPPRSTAAAVRQTFRRITAMGTVHEGGSGSGDGSGGTAVATRQLALCGDAAIEAAAAAMMVIAEPGICDVGHQGLGTALEAAVPSAKLIGSGSLLPDLELRGHSASSMARLEPSRDGEYCNSYSAPKGGDSGVGTLLEEVKSRSSSAGDSSSNSRSCLSTDAHRMPAAAAAATLSVSAGEAGSSGGGHIHSCISLAVKERKDDGAAVNGIKLGHGNEDAATSANRVMPAARNGRLEAPPPPPPPLLSSLQLPDIRTVKRPEVAAHGDAVITSSTATAAAAAIGTSGRSLNATGSMPRTPVAVQVPSGGCSGGGYHQEEREKVAKWIYVVDPELRLFVHPKVRGRFHHSSFLRGGAVVAAGGLAARHGRLRLLTADSGHYWPREENFKWLCEHLVCVGADLSACELRSKHMQVPAATGKELMEKMGVPPPWRLPYQPAMSPSGRMSVEPSGLDAPPSPLAEHMHMVQLQGGVPPGVEEYLEAELGGGVAVRIAGC